MKTRIFCLVMLALLLAFMFTSCAAARALGLAHRGTRTAFPSEAAAAPVANEHTLLSQRMRYKIMRDMAGLEE